MMRRSPTTMAQLLTILTAGGLLSPIQGPPVRQRPPCSQIDTTNTFIRDNVAGICAGLKETPFDTSLSRLLAVVHDRDRGIESNAYSRESMRSVIVCGHACDKPGAMHEPEWSIFGKFLRDRQPPGAASSRDLRSQFELAYIHILEARPILDYRLATLTGCTGAARVVGALAEQLGFDVRYLTTFVVTDYAAACRVQGRPRSPRVIINGHQVIAIQVPDGRWQLVDSSARHLRWATDFRTHRTISAAAPEELLHRKVDFGHTSDDGSPKEYQVSGVFTLSQITAILNDWQAHDRLMNLYASGDAGSPACRQTVQ